MLDEAETYAAGALFALALYCTSIEAAAPRLQAGSEAAGAWGVPFDDISDSYCADSSPSRPCAGWGWGLVSRQGLCGRVFAQLGVKDSAAVTLLTLPESLTSVDESERSRALCDMVTAYAHHLDAQLTFTPQSDSPAMNWRNQAPSQDTAAPSRDDSTSADAIDDVQLDAEFTTSCGDGSDATARDSVVTRPAAETDAVQESEQTPEALTSAPSFAPSFTRSDVEHKEEEALRAALMSLQGDPEAVQRISAQNRTVEEAHLTEGAVLCEPCFQPATVYTHTANPQCFEALQAVLAGCLRPEAAANPTSPSQKAARSPRATAQGPQPQTQQQRNAAETRWYDARARVACLRLAHWLRVPLATVTALEAALFHTAADVATGAAASDAQLHSYHDRSGQWLKVGAAAVGGGVLTAVTAGLAAPAIVAGIGAMVGMTGSAAAGAAISGAAATTASVGIVTGSSGAAGAAFYSSKMARRTADVSEFGFVQLSQWDAISATEASASEGSNKERPTAPSADSAAPAQPGRAASTPDGGGSAKCAHGDADSAGKGSEQSSSTRPPPGCSSTLPAGSSVTRQGSGAKRRSWSAWASGGSGRRRSGASRNSSAALADEPTCAADLLATERLLAFPQNRGTHGGVLVAANGWIASRSDFVTPFRNLDRRKGNAFALVWESRELLAISRALMKMLARSASQNAIQLGLYATVQGLATATIWPVAVLNCAYLLDSAFDVACVRAKRGGKLLANMLLARCHGDAPVTLLGVSVGARLVYHCCLELYKHGACGIIEHVVLLGAPVSWHAKTLRMVRRVVAGRCINCFSSVDWVLSLSFRAKIGQGAFKGILGLKAAEQPGFEDLDFSALVRSHGDWCKHADHILHVLGLDAAAAEAR